VIIELIIIFFLMGVIAYLMMELHRVQDKYTSLYRRTARLVEEIEDERHANNRYDVSFHGIMINLKHQLFEELPYEE